MDYFSLRDRVCIVTGGLGLMGRQHIEAIIEAGGIPINWDISETANMNVGMYQCVDITNPEAVSKALQEILDRYGRIDALVNNAAINPKMEDANSGFFRLENYPLDIWEKEIAIGLTGALICSQQVGQQMAKQGRGVIINIASDLGLIAPDQRLYRNENVAEDRQPVKPVSYSVIKHGIIGLTKYLATYWADKGVRSNALCPGGIYDGQPDEFVKKLVQKIPMGRMAEKNEYKASLIYLLSDASSYMNGAILATDGGRTTW